MTKRGSGEGSIYRRATDGRWTASVSVDGKRKTFYGQTQQEARKKLRDHQTALEAGRPARPPKLKTGDYLRSWLGEHVKPRVRPTTFKAYEIRVRCHLIPALGHIPLIKLTPFDVERMIGEQLLAGMAPRSVQHNRAILRKALNDARRWGLVDRNAAALAEPPAVVEPERTALTVDQARALLAAIRGDRLEAAYILAVALGLRQSEVLGLRWSDIDFDPAALQVERTLQRANRQYQFFPPKSRTSRRAIPLAEPVIAALREHRIRQLEERLRAGGAWQGEQWGDLVFCDELGRPLAGTHVTRRLRKLLVAADLPAMRYHDLRHGVASVMTALGVPPRVVMEVLGHAQISTTMEVYTHIPSAVKREAVEQLAAALWAD